MTADVTRRDWTQQDLAREASQRSHRAHKKDTTARDLLNEARDGYRNQPKAWNPEQWMARVELFLATS